MPFRPCAAPGPTAPIALLAAALLATPAPGHGPRPAEPAPVVTSAPPAAPSGAPPIVPAPHVAAPPPLALVGVTVVPMDSERTLPDHTVLVRAGRIAAVAPSARVEVPGDAHLVDGRGRWLAPGLADMHVHVWTSDEFPLFLANGITTLRNMWGSPLQLQWREAAARGELLAPTIVTAGPLVDGSPPIWNGSRVVETPEQAVALVEELAGAGYDAVKVYDRLSRDAYESLVAAAHEHGLPVWGHVPDAVGLAGAIASGQSSIEHLTGFADVLVDGDDVPAGPGSRWTRLAAADPAGAVPWAERLAAAGLWSCPTLVVMRRLVPPARAERLLAEPVMRFVSPATRATWDPARDFRTAGLQPDDWEAIRRGDQVRLCLVAALHEAGAGLLLGTDSPNPFVVPGFAIHQELAALVEAGLSPFEAIAAGTREAARFLGQADEFGTVAVGRRADLLLLDADPLRDVAALREPAGVVLRGRWLDRATLDGALEEVAARHADDRDRMADLPPLPEGDDVVFAATYELTFNDEPYASERVAWMGRDGARRLVSQLVYDPPIDEVQLLDVRWDGAKRLSLAAESRTAAGTGRLRLTADDASVTLAGSGVWAGLALTRPRPPDALLALPSLGAERALCDVLADLAPGEERDVPRLVLGLGAEVTLDEGRVHLRRLADDADGARVVEIVSTGRDGSRLASTLRLDRDGRPLSLEIHEQLGVIRATRTP